MSVDNADAEIFVEEALTKFPFPIILSISEVTNPYPNFVLMVVNDPLYNGKLNFTV